MRRRLFNLLAAVSLLLAATILAAWVLSYSHGYTFENLSRADQSNPAPPKGTWRPLYSHMAVTGGQGSVTLIRWRVETNCDGGTGGPKSGTGQRFHDPYRPSFGPTTDRIDAAGVRFERRSNPQIDGLDETHVDGWLLSLPFYLPMVAAVLGMFACLQFRGPAAVTEPAMRRCSGCGYDLRATPERCPECGYVTQVRA